MGRSDSARLPCSHATSSPAEAWGGARHDEAVELEPTRGYAGELRHPLAAIAAGRGEPRVTVEDARSTARLLDAECESFERGGARVEVHRGDGERSVTLPWTSG